MARLTYDTTETLVYDPVSANRAQTRAALYTLGFRYIESVATLETFAENLRKRPPDLALCEAQSADADLCNLIQNVRQGGGYNPFVVIIVTAWDKSNALAGRVINSGADDLLLRPFSIAQLGQRIKTHAEKRKDFVITTDYVGPDRRRDAHRPPDATLFHAPNSLQMKAQDGLPNEEVAKRLDDELGTAREAFRNEKLRRDAFQICVLWRLLRSYVPESPKYRSDIAKLSALAESIAARSRETDYEAAQKWCEYAISAVEGLAAGVDRSASMSILGHAALNLCKIFDPGTSDEARLELLDATVAVIQARSAMELAS